MSRETAQNVLIGAMLLLILGGGFAVCAEAFGFALYSADLAVRHYLPSVAHAWRIELLGFISVVILIGCARQVRKRLWMNAFLSFTGAVTMVLPWLLSGDLHRVLGGPSLGFPMVWFIVLILPQATRASRGEFVGCAAMIATAFAVNSGLLGRGRLETVTEIGFFIAILAWVFVRSRDGSFGEPWRIFSPSST